VRRYPKWVISGHTDKSAQYPLYPVWWKRCWSDRT